MLSVLLSFVGVADSFVSSFFAFRQWLRFAFLLLLPLLLLLSAVASGVCRWGC